MHPTYIERSHTLNRMRDLEYEVHKKKIEDINNYGYFPNTSKAI